MSIEIKIVNEGICQLGAIGLILRRSVEITGMRNTAGEPEVYHASLNGFYNDGSLRFDVFVQRPNGSFAILNSNKHYQRIGKVGAALKSLGMVSEYRTASAAALAGAVA